MRVVPIMLAVAAAFVLMAATTAIGVLSCLGQADIEIEPLVHGDLTGVFGSHVFWGDFPSWRHGSHLLAFGPAAMMATIGALLLASARRCPQLPASAFAWLALASGVVPYAVGAIVLHDNTDAPSTGRWLVWMLVGPAYAALLAFGFLLREPFLRWRQRRALAMPAAATAVAR